MKSFYTLTFAALCYCASAQSLPPFAEIGNCQGPVQNYFITYSQCDNLAAPEIPSDYTVVPGVGGLKLHLEQKSWNEARKTCVAEGGHLAIITSQAEEDLINSWRKQNNIGNAAGVWLGFHNLFNNKDWVSVIDQPLSASHTGWTKLIANLPDNAGGNQHCTRLIDYGMDDIQCETKYAFVCKIVSPARSARNCKYPSS